MNVYQSSKIRNVALVGHSGSGKTTLAETMLYESGAIQKRGSVEEQNTVSDYHEIEHEKLKSVVASFMHLDWRGDKINLVDTPGTTDYIGEVITVLHAVEAAVFVVDAQHGLAVGTEMIWRYAEDLQVPCFFIMNKMDHEKAGYQNTLDSLQERFGREVVPMQFPYAEGEGFNAIVDVLKMTMYEFPENGGKPEKLPIPDSLSSRADLLHNELVESVAENDEMLMEKYIEQGQLEESEMHDGLNKAVRDRQMFPLFILSAHRNMGSGRVMGFIGNVVDSPVDAMPPETVDGQPVEVNPDGRASAFLFKNIFEEHVGDMMYFKVRTGTLKANMDLQLYGKGSGVRLSTLYVTQGGKRLEVPEVRAGDIATVVKLKEGGVNDTLHEKGFEVGYKPITYPEPTVRTAIRATNRDQEEKLGSALHQIQKEDPSLQVEHSAELKQTIISAQGEEHLGMVQHRLENRNKVDVEYLEPSIPYRETITRKVTSQYRHKKQTGGAGQFGEVCMIIEPLTDNMPEPKDINVRDEQVIDLDWGGQLVFRNCIVGGVIDTRFMPAILKGIMEKMENGPMSGCRARDVRVSVYDGSMHPVDSNEAAFKAAAMMAFRKGFLDAGPQLLEPIYEVEVMVPEDYMGDVMSDLSSRRGQIQGTDAEGELQRVKALVPLAELYRYATQLKSMTQGRATHSRRFYDYEPVPQDIQDRIMKQTAEMESG